MNAKIKKILDFVREKEIILKILVWLSLGYFLGGIFDLCRFQYGELDKYLENYTLWVGLITYTFLSFVGFILCIGFLSIGRKLDNLKFKIKENGV